MANTIDYTIGGAREDLSRIDAAEIENRKNQSLLVEDYRRTRPRYFDGRFLAARDLTREQVYALSRQADLSVAHHGGVIRGLELTRLGDTLRLSAGTGFTPNGELVSLATTLSTSIAQIPEDDRIDLSHGLVDVAEPPARNRTGLYLLGIRPGEYATHPITRYPLTSLGAPGKEDGDIVEAVALALHPLRHDTDADPNALRSELARTLFLEGGSDLPADLLALAVVYLRGGSIAWFDPYLVRREVGADDAVSIGLGNQQRAVREAHFLQYDRQLAELVTDLRARGGLRFPASRYFRCLPPVGRLPVAALDSTDFTQAYFPPQMTVSLGVVVDEELPALLEASMHLPPIDLEGSDEDFDFAYIQVLVPMPARAIQQLRLEAVLVPRIAVTPAVLVKRLPVLALRDFLIKRKPVEGPDFGHDTRTEAAPLLAAWRQALAAAPDQLAWFVRVPPLSAAPAALFDPPPKDKEKDKEKAKEKDKEASADKTAAEDKAASADKPASEDKGIIADKPASEDKAASADKGTAADKLPTDKSIIADKLPADKSLAADKALEKTSEKSAAADKAIADKPLAADKPADKSIALDKTTDKTVIADKASEKVLEKTAEKSIIADKASEKVADKTAEKAPDKTADTKTADKALEKTVEKTAEKTAEKSAEKLSDKLADKTTDTKATDKLRETKPAGEAKASDVVIAVPRDVVTPPTPTPSSPTPTPVTGSGRTFIQPTERPDVGGTVIRKTRDT